MNSPLQLKRIAFTRVHVDSHAEPGPVSTEIATNASLGVSLNTANPRLIMVKLEVRFGPAKDSPTVYSGEVSAIGEFEVHPDVQVEVAQKLGVVNGASILFGAIREMITNVTARSPIGVPLILATMSFTSTAEDALKDIATKRRAAEEAAQAGAE